MQQADLAESEVSLSNHAVIVDGMEGNRRVLDNINAYVKYFSDRFVGIMPLQFIKC